MSNSLLPITKLVLAVSAVTQFVFGLAMVFAPDLANSFLWPPPFDPWPVLTLRYQGVLFLAMSLGAASALRENDWRAGRVYLVIAGPYVALCVVLAILAAATPPGVPLIMWLYVFLSIIYLPLVAYVWRQESAAAIESGA
jgi:hypothetical protein